MPSNPGPSPRFVFNPSSATDNPYVTEIRNELKKLEDQIQDLNDRVVIHGVPWFQHFIHNLPPEADLKEVKIFGKALIKYVDLKPQLDAARKKIAVIDGAKSNPDLMALAFAETSDFGDKFTELLTGDDK